MAPRLEVPFPPNYTNSGLMQGLKVTQHYFLLFILSSAILIMRLTISPPTDPFSRAVVSAPSSTSNSLAISSFIASTAFSAPGTNNSFLLLSFAIGNHSSGCLNNLEQKQSVHTISSAKKLLLTPDKYRQIS